MSAAVHPVFGKILADLGLSASDAQSGGTTISARRNDLLAIRVIAERQPPASEWAVQVVLLELQTRGVSVSNEEADEIARRVVAGQAYRRQG